MGVPRVQGCGLHCLPSELHVWMVRQMVVEQQVCCLQIRELTDVCSLQEHFQDTSGLL
jgi:hypothetical protein